MFASGIVAFVHGRRVASPNTPKLSDGGGWSDGCAGEGGGAASVIAGAVRCSAWLGVFGVSFTANDFHSGWGNAESDAMAERIGTVV